LIPAIGVHIDMGRSGIVETALQADATTIGGLRYR
jgi:hypothetical protein